MALRFTYSASVALAGQRYPYGHSAITEVLKLRVYKAEANLLFSHFPLLVSPFSARDKVYKPAL